MNKRLIPVTLVLTILSLFVSLVLFSYLSENRCKTGSGSDCSDPVDQSACYPIFALTIDGGSEKYIFTCGWYSSVTGIGLSSVSLSIIFVVLVAMGEKLNKHRDHTLRILTGLLGATLLFIAFAIMLSDLNNAPLPVDTSNYSYSRGIYGGNIFVAILSAILVSFLTFHSYKLREGAKAGSSTGAPNMQGNRAAH